jgi:hypothetical protein
MDCESTGKNPTVAPYSGHMLEMVARSAMDKAATPGPKNSTNLPTTPICLRCLVMVNTTSVDVTKGCSRPVICVHIVFASVLAK